MVQSAHRKGAGWWSRWRGVPAVSQGAPDLADLGTDAALDLSVAATPASLTSPMLHTAFGVASQDSGWSGATSPVSG